MRIRVGAKYTDARTVGRETKLTSTSSAARGTLSVRIASRFGASNDTVLQGPATESSSEASRPANALRE